MTNLIINVTFNNNDLQNLMVNFRPYENIYGKGENASIFFFSHNVFCVGLFQKHVTFYFVVSKISAFNLGRSKMSCLGKS